MSRIRRPREKFQGKKSEHFQKQAKRTHSHKFAGRFFLSVGKTQAKTTSTSFFAAWSLTPVTTFEMMSDVERSGYNHFTSKSKSMLD